MVSADDFDSLRGGWLRILAGHDIPVDPALRDFDRLAAIYSTPDRAYHTLEHLAEMSRIVDRLAPVIADLDAVRLAVWFHDAVYDTHRSDNEERSAELAGTMLIPLGLERPLVDRVAAYTRATAHLGTFGSPPDRDTAALLDADLAILGAAPERYGCYARDIRLEYRWVPEADYRCGRADVLRLFLSRRRIYHHAVMHAEHEAHARRNIMEELESISSGLDHAQDNMIVRMQSCPEGSGEVR